MSDLEKSQVEIKSDVGSDSIGQDRYIQGNEGKFNAQGFRGSALVAIFFTVIAFAAMLFNSRKNPVEHKSKPLSSPEVSGDQLDLGSRIMTQKDLTNLIPHPRVLVSDLGQIRVVSLRSIAEVPIGSEMHAILESGATDGIVKARLTAPLLVDGEPAIPERAVLFGKGKSGEERLMVEFTKIIFPSGESFPIRAQAFDATDKILGLKGAVVGTRTKKMAQALAFGFAGGMADGLQTTSGSMMFMPQRPSARDAALSGASKAALDQSQEYMEELKKSPNIIEVKAGSELVVIVDEPKKKESEKYGRE